MLALALLLAAPVWAAEPQPQMIGDVQIHDPSVIEIGGHSSLSARDSRGQRMAPFA
jgi:hypothetical protein